METNTQNEAEAQSIIESIEYKAYFVPFSQSRNKDNKDKSLNWVVTLKRNGVEIQTDYMQGIGHHPHFNSKKGTPYWKDRMLANSVESGMVYKYDPWQSADDPWSTRNLKPLPKPELKDVLYSLNLDSDVMNYSGFEDWADCFGYDTDSRSAEKIHNQCLRIGLKWNQMFNEAEREALNEYFQDY